MKTLAVLIVMSLPLLCLAQAAEEAQWKTVDEGFRMTIPVSWQKKIRQPIDSNCGTYTAKSAELEFDEYFNLGAPHDHNAPGIAKLKEMAANPTQLKPGVKIVHVGGRLGRLSIGPVDPKIYGERRFPMVASLLVLYEDEPAHLVVRVFFTSDDDFTNARRVLSSIEWKKKPNQSPEPTPTAVTPRAEGKKPE
jgi:hypothetical protein